LKDLAPLIGEPNEYWPLIFDLVRLDFVRGSSIENVAPVDLFLLRLSCWLSPCYLMLLH
jgi:hypothetical protein